jgi:serine protease Do
MGTAKDIMVGETVIAIGNAYGYEHTVTVGVVSALKRDVTLNKEVSYRSLIQTDASINPGNSGGPLLNVNGEMIGVNVAIRAGAQGISFAIPVDSMIQTVTEMLSARKRGNLWHGLVCRNRVSADGQDARETSNNEAKLVKLTHEEPPPLKRELIVERVETGSPAASAGLQPDDMVVQVGDLAVTSSLDLERAFLDRAAGDHISVVVRRKGIEQKLDLVLKGVEKTESGPAEMVWQKLGLRVKPADADAVARISRQLHGGMTVVEVNPNGIADKAGIQQGDILVGLHQWETLSLDNITFVLTHPDLANFNPLCFYIIRSGQVRRGWLQQIN